MTFDFLGVANTVFDWQLQEPIHTLFVQKLANHWLNSTNQGSIKLGLAVCFEPGKKIGTEH